MLFGEGNNTPNHPGNGHRVGALAGEYRSRYLDRVEKHQVGETAADSDRRHRQTRVAGEPGDGLVDP